MNRILKNRDCDEGEIMADVRLNPDEVLAMIAVGFAAKMHKPVVFVNQIGGVFSVTYVDGNVRHSCRDTTVAYTPERPIENGCNRPV